jgi:glutathione S-transferase
MTNDRGRYRVHGMTQSYFTRKMTGYLDYKGIPWALRRTPGVVPDAAAAGWTGGIPPVQTPEGEWMWDSTAMIHHLERRFPEPAVLPPDPVQRFLCYLIEDVCDEWLYRPAVGSRWFVPENARLAGWELARDLTVASALPCETAHALAGAHVRSSCGPLGVREENVQSWIDEILRPWTRALGDHLEGRPFLFGDRPSLADFAVFGGNAAHFVNDPACRRWTEEDAPAVVRHTHRLLESELCETGDWSGPGDVPATLVALLADAGRLYLPWVARATATGAAELAFTSGARVEIGASPFLVEARATLLGRYVGLRCDPLDAVLERAGILGHFADHAGSAGPVPADAAPPRPALNRPFPPADAV